MVEELYDELGAPQPASQAVPAPTESSGGPCLALKRKRCPGRLSRSVSRRARRRGCSCASARCNAGCGRHQATIDLDGRPQATAIEDCCGRDQPAAVAELPRGPVTGNQQPAWRATLGPTITGDRLPLCRRFGRWLQRQAAWVRSACLSSDSAPGWLFFLDKAWAEQAVWVDRQERQRDPPSRLLFLNRPLSQRSYRPMPGRTPLRQAAALHRCLPHRRHCEQFV